MVGTTVSHYKIVREIGRGGMGVVYEAEDVRLGRRVALKFLPREMVKDEQALRRFEFEARAACALEHESVCTIFDVDDVDGQPFIAMELLDGEALSERLLGQPLPLDAVLDIGIQISDALDAAQRKGIVHRDIKPANIFLTARGRVKVLDFGLAKQVADPLYAAAGAATVDVPGHLTSPGSAVGTVAYMSPEQARGEQLDSRTDLFSFGAVLYQLATGKMPFDGPTSAVIFTRILEKETVPPSQHNPDLPPKLDEIVGKALEKDRELRYQTASEMRADLKRLKRDSESGKTNVGAFRVVAATDPSGCECGPMVAPPSAKPSHIRKWLIAAIAMVVLASAAAAAWFWRARSAAPEISSIAVLPFSYDRKDSEHEFLADGITEDVINNLAQVPGLKVMARATVFRYKGKDMDPIQVGRELKVDAVLTGRLEHNNEQMTIQTDLVRVSDGAQIWGQQFTRPEAQAHDLQADITREISQMLRMRVTGAQMQHMTAAKTQNPEAYELYLKGRFDMMKRTSHDLSNAISELQQAIDKDPSYAEAHSALAMAYELAPSYGVMPSDKAGEQSKAEAKKALDLDPNLGEPHIAEAVELTDEFKWDEAEREFRRGMALNPNDATAHYFYARTCLMPQARYDDAIAEYRKALDLDPFSAIINTNFAVLLTAAGRQQEALDQFRKTLDIDPHFGVALDRASEYYAYLGRYDEAWKILNRDHPERLKFYTGGGKDAFYAAVLKSLPASDDAFVPSLLYAAWGKKDEALQELRKFVVSDPNDAAVFLRAPEYDSLRGDPRFNDILKSMNLKP